MCVQTKLKWMIFWKALVSNLVGELDERIQ